MMEALIKKKVQVAMSTLFSAMVPEEKIGLQKTRKDFDGDITLVIFPLLPFMRGTKVEDAGHLLGENLLGNLVEIESFNVIKGFLNLRFKSSYWLEQLLECGGAVPEPKPSELPRKIVIEYSSPNTNKPLHLGHIRNNLLGFSLARLLEANGHQVKKVNLVNDRGIHICKSMLAWQKWGQGESPENSGMKGDHLIGKYYVLFDRHFKEEAAALKLQGLTEDEVQQTSPLMQEAREMLRKWEQEDQEVRALWEKMNTWVYVGFEETYRRLGIDFDQIYYESETYKLGKELVEEGLDKGVFFRKEDGSVWADLSPYGLDEKLLLRADGTSVYMTQDLGTAQLRHDDYDADELVYVVGNEQNYHFEVLPRLLEMLGRPWSKAIRHFSYGMVELPQGKMKSREGTVVDADELMDEMIATARNMAQEHGKLEGLSEEEADLLFGMIGLGALKYFILKVDPKKKMMFNPEESVDFNGNTGPFIQYTHARIQSLRRKADASGMTGKVQIHLEIGEKERSLIKLLMQYPDTLSEAGQAYSPALIANYLFDLAREFNQFYHEHPVLAEENKALASFRLALSNSVGAIIKEGMHILGISVPDKM